MDLLSDVLGAETAMACGTTEGWNVAASDNDERLYAHLRVLDDLLDDHAFTEWRTTGEVPRSVAEVMASDAPCATLRGALTEQALHEIPIIAGPDGENRAALWRLCNALVFHMGRIADLGAGARVGDTSDENIARILALARSNMQLSYLATLVCRSVKRDVGIRHAAALLPTVLADGFVSNAHGAGVTLLERYRHTVELDWTLEAEMYFQGYHGQVANDTSDILTDLEVEAASGRVTPNAVLAAWRELTYADLSARWATMTAGDAARVRQYDETAQVASRARAQRRHLDIYGGIGPLPTDSRRVDVNALYAEIRAGVPDAATVTSRQLKALSPCTYVILVDACEQERGFEHGWIHLTHASKQRQRLERAQSGRLAHLACAGLPLPPLAEDRALDTST